MFAPGFAGSGMVPPGFCNVLARVSTSASRKLRKSSMEFKRCRSVMATDTGLDNPRRAYIARIAWLLAAMVKG